jgi:hypothetical protein
MKKILQRKTLEEKSRFEADCSEMNTPIVPKLKLPLPKTPSSNNATSSSENDTPRSQGSNSVYVVPIPVFDIDDNESIIQPIIQSKVNILYQIISEADPN